MRRAGLGLAMVGLLAGEAVSQPASTPAAGPPLLTAKELMQHIVNPAAELFWKGSGTVDTEEGAASRAPTSDATWLALVNAAATLQESGILLTAPGRPQAADWTSWSRQLALAGAAGVKAARAKDEEAVFAAGSAMYETCFACHRQYIPRPANSLYNQRLPDDAFKEPGAGTTSAP